MTTEKTWTFIDKTGWGEGEWQREADKYQYVDPDTGFPCLIVRNHMGALCGYVGVSEGHPLFGVDALNLSDLIVHGGVTYTDFCQEGSEHEICHALELGQPDRVWWVGFDCAHSGDGVPKRIGLYKSALYKSREHYKNVSYVKSEIKELARQLQVTSESCLLPC